MRLAARPPDREAVRIERCLTGLFRRGFAHGVHPQGFKEQTADLPTQRMPFVGRYVMPLNQHLGAPAIPLSRSATACCGDS